MVSPLVPSVAGQILGVFTRTRARTMRYLSNTTDRIFARFQIYEYDRPKPHHGLLSLLSVVRVLYEVRVPVRVVSLICGRRPCSPNIFLALLLLFLASRFLFFFLQSLSLPGSRFLFPSPPFPSRCLSLFPCLTGPICLVARSGVYDYDSTSITPRRSSDISRTKLIYETTTYPPPPLSPPPPPASSPPALLSVLWPSTTVRVLLLVQVPSTVLRPSKPVTRSSSSNPQFLPSHPIASTEYEYPYLYL